MKREFSDEQKQAICEQGHNILVAAGAGSGKTTVLTERVLARVTGADAVDIDRLLVLTFTNAAAAEMRARIEEGLIERLKHSPDERPVATCDGERLARQLALIQQAPITTIHSFCLDLVRRHFYRLGLDAGFRIPSEVERAILHEEVLAAFMESQYEREDALLVALADAYGGPRDDSGLLAIVDELYRFSRSQPHPEQWLRGAAETFARADHLAEYKRQRPPGKRTVAAMEEDMRALTPLMERLADLVIDYSAALAAEKRRRNLLDFDDMEHFCLRLLEDEASGVAALLRQRFAELLIDEYQDINAVQEHILSLLSRGDNRFAVGDVKQSIYRFRLAEPSLFLQKYHAYGAGHSGARIDLNRNYRSCGQVIDAVNYIFRQLMTEPVAGLDYDAAAELVAGRKERGAAAELWLIERNAPAKHAPGREEQPPCTPDSDARGGPDAFAAPPDASAAAPDEAPLAAEARLVGRRILELRREGYQFRDMAILLRAAKNRESVIAYELAQMGIPALAAKQSDYLQTPEIGLMLSLLAIIDNPLQEPELAAVLRSPLFGFSLDELAELRFAAPDQQLWAGLTAQARGEGTWPDKCRRFITQINEWRFSLRLSRVSELIWRIYRETGLLSLVASLPGGEQRQENLLLLYQRAREYEAGSYRGLFRFLLFLADGRAKSADSGGEAAEGEDAVRVMSIHRSKGLEFPVVFVANLSGAFSLTDERRDIVWHKDLGLGPKVVERRQRRKFPSLAHEAVAQKLHQEAVAEEMRVLYVALTRARERLILSAGVKDIAKTLAAWRERAQNAGPCLDGALLAEDKRPLDWLGPALLRHPDAAPLREAAGVTAGSEEEKSLIWPGAGNWRFQIVPPEGAAGNAPAGERAAAVDEGGACAGDAGAASLEIPEDEISWQYPYRAVANQPAKWTVSELNRLAQPPEEAAEQAASLLTAEATEPSARQSRERAARRGLAQHKLLQYLDFARAQSVEAVREQMEQLAQQGLLSAEEMGLVEAGHVARFAQSDVAGRLAAAPRQLREAAFTYALPAGELSPEAAPEDKLVLQGVIDAAFWEEGGWVLLDYKTGGHGQTERQLRERYAAQIGYYRRALQEIRGEPVKEAWLCFIDLGKNIRL